MNTFFCYCQAEVQMAWWIFTHPLSSVSRESKKRAEVYARYGLSSK